MESSPKACSSRSLSTSSCSSAATSSAPGQVERRREERTIRQRAKFWGAKGLWLSLQGLERVAVMYTVVVLVLCILEAFK